MKIGIIGAMQMEVDALQAAMTASTSETVSGITFVSGKIGEHDVIINIGVAGTVTKGLSVLDIAIADNVCQHDMDTSPLGDPVGLVSGINQIYFPADKKLAEAIGTAADKLGCRHITGTIASGDQFIASREKKDWIVSTFSGIACEMEGASVGQVCYVNKVPFVILRAISDSADGGACEDYPTFAKNAAKTSASVVLALAGL